MVFVLRKLGNFPGRETKNRSLQKEIHSVDLHGKVARVDDWFLCPAIVCKKYKTHVFADPAIPLNSPHFSLRHSGPLVGQVQPGIDVLYPQLFGTLFVKFKTISKTRFYKCTPTWRRT